MRRGQRAKVRKQRRVKTASPRKRRLAISFFTVSLIYHLFLVRLIEMAFALTLDDCNYQLAMLDGWLQHRSLLHLLIYMAVFLCVIWFLRVINRKAIDLNRIETTLQGIVVLAILFVSILRPLSMYSDLQVGPLSWAHFNSFYTEKVQRWPVLTLEEPPSTAIPNTTKETALYKKLQEKNLIPDTDWYAYQIFVFANGDIEVLKLPYREPYKEIIRFEYMFQKLEALKTCAAHNISFSEQRNIILNRNDLVDIYVTGHISHEGFRYLTLPSPSQVIEPITW